MSSAWKNAERRAAKALGGTRAIRASRDESIPDVVNVPGWCPEVKYRKTLPVLITGALRQAQGYAILGQKPVAVLFEKGKHGGLVVLRLEDFAELIRQREEVRP